MGNAVVVVVGNKVDADSTRAVPPMDCQAFATDDVGYFETSARYGTCVEDLFDYLVNQLLDRCPSRDSRLPSRPPAEEHPPLPEDFVDTERAQRHSRAPHLIYGRKLQQMLRRRAWTS